MNYAIFLGILNLILLSRLRLMLRDDGITRSDLWVMTIIPLLGLPFLEVSLGWILLAFYLVGNPALIWMLEKRKKRLNRNRILMLILHIMSVAVLCSPIFELSANELAANLLAGINVVFLPGIAITDGTVTAVYLFIFGFLMVLNETNIILRYILKLVGLKSLGKTEEVDQKEYNTGRIIGLLERTFVFLFVLLNQFAAIGFILAAKGVTRFKDFESRTFAEYVLIGTLLSALLAMGIAFLVKVVL
ncbi:hypothetical protein CK503_09590 [Aliifodinibius salipaludis]|uniref:DUF3307 domain-containing protein n=1 Tax=Fodinibius salipaludis TaxID=2032627 RepID=A0A2A2GAP6_9BACT|nr:hypothetical protein [Aliifodinibius salipaludis]PAU93915.1 hypothetical protein CK503_09590 [Aliifodinibius salipaludis]